MRISFFSINSSFYLQKLHAEPAIYLHINTTCTHKCFIGRFTCILKFLQKHRSLNKLSTGIINITVINIDSGDTINAMINAIRNCFSFFFYFPHTNPRPACRLTRKIFVRGKYYFSAERN